MTVLRSWLGERGGLPADPLFITRRGTPLSRDALERRIAKYTATAAKTCPSLLEKKVSPHVFRHSAAMRLLAAGVDTQSSHCGWGTFQGIRNCHWMSLSGPAERCFCQTLCLSCVTWITAQHTGSQGPQ